MRSLALKDGETLVATVFDLLCANYGLDRGLGGGGVAADYDQDEPYTPAWAERVTGVPRAHIIHVAREFTANAEATKGRSMVILGAGVNHWYHMDMTYRGIINLLVLCGCVGQSGGGWSEGDATFTGDNPPGGAACRQRHRDTSCSHSWPVLP